VAVFAVAVSGVRLERIVLEKHSDFNIGATSITAVQNGCFVAIAPWISLTSDIRLRGCFALECFEGTLEGLSEDWGIVRCEKGVEATGSNLGDSRIPDDDDVDDEDPAELQIKTAMFRVGSLAYRLMTMATSGSYVRVVDPTTVLHALCRTIFTKCSHGSTGKGSSGSELSDETKFQLYDLEEILAQWDQSFGVNNTVQTTKVLTARHKFNVALALSIHGAAVAEFGLTCLACALRQSRENFTNSPLRLVSIKNRDFTHTRRIFNG
jgi:hypothetical protein